MNIHPKLKHRLHYLSTSAAAAILPDLAEDYGENKNLDVNVSFSKTKF